MIHTCSQDPGTSPPPWTRTNELFEHPDCRQGCDGLQQQAYWELFGNGMRPQDLPHQVKMRKVADEPEMTWWSEGSWTTVLSQLTSQCNKTIWSFGHEHSLLSLEEQKCRAWPKQHRCPRRAPRYIISVFLQRLQDNLTLKARGPPLRWVVDDNRPRHTTRPTRLWLRHRVASPASRP